MYHSVRVRRQAVSECCTGRRWEALRCNRCHRDGTRIHYEAMMRPPGVLGCGTFDHISPSFPALVDLSIHMPIYHFSPQTVANQQTKQASKRLSTTTPVSLDRLHETRLRLEVAMHEDDWHTRSQLQGETHEMSLFVCWW